MRWSIRLGRVFGIPVNLHLTFLLLLGLIGANQIVQTGTLSAAFGAVGFIVAIFTCVALHEFGHALAARRFGIRTRDVTLLPFGGLARLERMPRDPVQELWIALAGPAVNVAIAGILGFALVMTGAGQLMLGTPSLFGGTFFARLLVVNVILALFNLLPAFPMDGGRVLRALLAMRFSYVRATGIAATVGKGMALLFGLLGLFGNPMLIFIAVFVWFGGSAELAMARHMAAPAWGPAAGAVRQAWVYDERGERAAPVTVRVDGNDDDDGPHQRVARQPSTVVRATRSSSAATPADPVLRQASVPAR